VGGGLGREEGKREVRAEGRERGRGPHQVRLCHHGVGARGVEAHVAADVRSEAAEVPGNISYHIMLYYVMLCYIMLPYLILSL
jgi:hypothetical protein